MISKGLRNHIGNSGQEVEDEDEAQGGQDLFTSTGVPPASLQHRRPSDNGEVTDSEPQRHQGGATPQDKPIVRQDPTTSPLHLQQGPETTPNWSMTAAGLRFTCTGIASSDNRVAAVGSSSSTQSIEQEAACSREKRNAQADRRG